MSQTSPICVLLRQTPERTHQQQHVRYLLSDAYPVIPVVTAPVISPEVAAHSVGSTAEFADTENVEDHVYVDIDGTFSLLE